MPTGYTAGILDGEITTFPQFAKLCMRAFGATMHLRDNPLDAKYEPLIPSDYHKKEIAKEKQLIEDVKTITDEDLIEEERLSLLESRKQCLEGIQKAKKYYDDLSKMLDYANQWIPPTSEHVGLKEFMVKQITETIDFDCKTDCYTERIAKLEVDLLSINADKIRQAMIEKAHNDLKYNKEANDKELKRCTDANQWVIDLLGSLDNA